MSSVERFILFGVGEGEKEGGIHDKWGWRIINLAKEFLKFEGGVRDRKEILGYIQEKWEE